MHFTCFTFTDITEKFSNPTLLLLTLALGSVQLAYILGIF